MDLFGHVAETPAVTHQSQLAPAANKFHVGNGEDGKHYWLTPPALYAELDAEFRFDFDPCPYPLPDGFDGLTCEWGRSSYVNPPFGSIMHQGPGDKKPVKKGPTAWMRKAIIESQKGKTVVLVHPLDKWVLMFLDLAQFVGGLEVRNLRDVKWLATEDGSAGKGTGRHIACFIFRPARLNAPPRSPVTPAPHRAAHSLAPPQGE
ncbi:MAG: hypothetical protein V4527_18335 [Pseudomonadota bacterium]